MTAHRVVDADDYYYRRAEAELARAQQADHPAAVRAHYILAGHYLDLTYGGPDAVAADCSATLD